VSIYVKLVCEALTDAKLLAAGPGGFWLWARGLLYAKQHLTDGVIPDAAMPLVAFGVADFQTEAAKLVTLKLWEPCEGGHRVPAKTWAKYQTTAADVEAMREKRSRAGKKGADVKWQKNGTLPENDGTLPSENGSLPKARNDQSTEYRVQSTDSKAQSTENTPIAPKGAVVSLPELPLILNTPQVRNSLESWLKYKGKAYKPQGMTAMVNRALAIAKEQGTHAVVEAIERAMANGWKGFDFANKPKSAPPAPPIEPIGPAPPMKPKCKPFIIGSNQ
jgi:hypothetical protein